MSVFHIYQHSYRPFLPPIHHEAQPIPPLGGGGGAGGGADSSMNVRSMKQTKNIENNYLKHISNLVSYPQLDI